MTGALIVTLLVTKFAPEARGHGVPEVMDAVYYSEGRIRPMVVDEADRIYQRAIREYRNSSPFAVAWVCFNLGVLWGELVPNPQLTLAARWYGKAIEYLPCYVKARVHLAEIPLKAAILK